MELLISNIQNEKFAFNLENIQEVIEKSSVEEIPNSPDFLEGIINYRKKVIPIFSLRKLMGMKSFHKEKCQELEEAKLAYKKWVDELKESIEKSEDFQEERDPNRCVLGQWINRNLKCMKCNNKGYVNLIKNHLVEPHEKLHRFAKNMSSQKATLKELEKVTREVDSGLTVLQKEIALLSNAFQKVIIYKLGHKVFGVAIDDIDRIIEVEKSKFKTTEVVTQSEFLKGDKIVEIGEKIVLVLEFNHEVIEEFDSFR